LKPTRYRKAHLLLVNTEGHGNFIAVLDRTGRTAFMLMPGSTISYRPQSVLAGYELTTSGPEQGGKEETVLGGPRAQAV